jgi:hypothetical protein
MGTFAARRTGVVMRRRDAAQVWVGSLLVVLAVAMAALPKNWIEATLHVSPDAESGSLELLVILGLSLIGLALIVPVAVRWVVRRNVPEQR